MHVNSFLNGLKIKQRPPIGYLSQQSSLIGHLSKQRPLIGQHLPGYPELAHPEVCQLDVAPGVQEDVLQLEVPVHNVVPVQKVDGEKQLGRIESRTYM